MKTVHKKKKLSSKGVFLEDSNQAFIVILSTKCQWLITDNHLVSSLEKRLDRQNSEQSVRMFSSSLFVNSFQSLYWVLCIFNFFSSFLILIKHANLIDLEAPCKPQSQSQLETPVCEAVSQTVSSLSSHMACLSMY